MQLLRVAIAVSKEQEMLRFYNQVFKAELQPLPTEAGTFYHGQIGQLALTFVPNSLAQVEATQNRHQLSFLVADIKAVIADAADAGGQQVGELNIGSEGTIGAVSDPDGNTIELFESKTAPGA